MRVIGELCFCGNCAGFRFIFEWAQEVKCPLY